MAITAEERQALMAKGIENVFAKNLAGNVGPFVIGLGIDMVLFGIMLAQFVRWASGPISDKLYIKAIVVITTLICTATSGCAIAYLFHLFVTGYGKWTPFADEHWHASFIVLAAPVMVLVQILYTDRAYRLQRNILVILISGAGILTHLVAAIIIRVRASESFEIAEHDDDGPISNMFYVWVGSLLATDTFLTVVIMHGLWKIKSEFSSTHKLIVRLLTALVLLVVDPDAPRSYCIIYFHAKVYVNGMLAVLNARTTLAGEVAISSAHRGHASGMTGSSSDRTNGVKVHTSRTEHIESWADKTRPVTGDVFQGAERKQGVYGKMSDAESGTLTLNESTSRLNNVEMDMRKP